MKDNNSSVLYKDSLIKKIWKIYFDSLLNKENFKTSVGKKAQIERITESIKRDEVKKSSKTNEKTKQQGQITSQWMCRHP